MNFSKTVILNLSLQELEEIIQRSVETALRRVATESDNENKVDHMLTRKEVAKMLSLSLPTLTKYVKQGKIPAHRIGNRILFKKTEIIESLKEVQNRKLFN